MNIRKNIDYSVMYNAIDGLMEKKLPQMELYCKIGKVVSQRTEKGAAVMAADHLNKQYPDVSGFSPRNIRRMREFYRTYENHPQLLRLATQIGWSQNMVIMEATLTMDLRKWYIKATKQFGWSKMKLIENIKNEVYKEIVLDIGQNLCNNKVNKNDANNFGEDRDIIVNIFGVYVFKLIQKRTLIFQCRGKPEGLCYVLCKR